MPRTPLTIDLRAAIEIWRQARDRIHGSPHPSLGCNCGICDIVRAGDLLAHSARSQIKERRWRVDPLRGPDRRATR